MRCPPGLHLRVRIHCIWPGPSDLPRRPKSLSSHRSAEAVEQGEVGVETIVEVHHRVGGRESEIEADFQFVNRVDRNRRTDLHAVFQLMIADVDRFIHNVADGTRTGSSDSEIVYFE